MSNGTDHFIIAYDLGTGGNKASLYGPDGSCAASAFVPYETFYPDTGRHEQCPADWWKAVTESTRELKTKSGFSPSEVRSISISGHSLGVVPVDGAGKLLRDKTPIWSDTRASRQTGTFFAEQDRDDWYMTTGNGFPAECYAVFKIMWYRDTDPEMFSKVHKILGTKDYINYKLTGRMATDYSYASGSGVYDLVGWRYSDDFIRASGLPADIFPEIVPSTEIIGNLTAEAAETLGLSTETRVVGGGVDNSCMALGARNIRDGRVYTSMGSSSWIAVSSKAPVLDAAAKPFVFTHVVPELFTSAVSIFAAGSSFRWLRDVVFADAAAREKETGEDPYEVMTRLAQSSPPGANRLLFNPSLAGGTSQEVNKEIRGAFAGLDLKHTRGDLVRSAMEGIAMNLAMVFEILAGFTSVEDTMLLVGGGSKSMLWRQIFADVFDMKMLKTNIDQDAGSLGAAAVAAVGTGLWDGFDRIDEVHSVLETAVPDAKRTAVYRDLRPAFQYLRETQAKLGEMLFSLASKE